MFVAYKPEDQPADAVQRWEFDPGRVRQSEAELVEKRYGANWEKFLADVQAGNAKARRVLLWHLMRRQHHTLKYEDVPDFLMSEVLVEHSVAELLALRDRIDKAKLDDSEREQIATALDIQISDAIAREQPGADPEELVGKASSPSGESPIG